MSEAGLTIRTYTGEQIPDRLFDEDIIYDLYTTTIQVGSCSHHHTRAWPSLGC